MSRKTLPRLTAAGAGWSHPYPVHPFAPTFYADGGDGDGSGSDSGDDSNDGQDDGAAGTGDQGAGPGQDSGGQRESKDAEDHTATIKRLEKELHTARSEAGKARNAAKQQAADDAVKELTQKLGQALGLVKDETPPDPAALAEAIAQKDTTISERDSVIRAKDVELTVWGRADKLSAKAAALLDSRSFLQAIADLDPSAKGFTSAVDDAIRAAVKENPSFAVQAAGKSGGDLSGGTGEGDAKPRPTSLSAAVRGAFNT
ncbi:hypothetical protein [Streptomyces sp. NPDC006274]|uniref:hypothetical protein n=1 Tax=unclassified Streptomyces TaxID=2593676 RepID=UPI0033B04E1D